MPTKRASTPPQSPTQQLANFLKKYPPATAREARGILTRLRHHAPGATEMIYDNYNGLVVGFSPNERPSDAVFSLVLYFGRIAVCFLQAGIPPRLPDPRKLLIGEGKQVRTLRVHAAKDLDDPAVRDLFEAAVASARVPFDPRRKSVREVRVVAKRQVPRRPG